MAVQELNCRIVEGTGTPLVFIHGWMGDMDSWSRVEACLDVANLQLYYDQRCHGNSACDSFDTFEELADDLYQLLQDESVEQPVIVGHSMGGMVALTYATLYDDLSGLSVMCTGACTPEHRVESLDDTLKGLDQMDREQWAERMVEDHVPVENDAVRRFLKRRAMEAEDDLLYSSLRAIKQYDVRDAINDVDVPVQVIGAERDQVVPRSAVQQLAGLLNCQVTWIDASHMVLYDAPTEVSAALRNSVAEIPVGEEGCR